MTTPQRRLYIKTYGCQMNVYDSERMAETLGTLGYALCETPEEADMVLLNTCHIREKASEKVYSELGRLNQLRADKQQQGKDLVIGVAGCVAQAEGKEMLRRAPYVDMVVGPQAYHQLPELVARAHRRRAEAQTFNRTRGALATDFPLESKFDYLPEQRTPTNPYSAFLTIQEGCDKFCTFCVVPYTRGAEFSRPAASILAEARALAAQGVREITLLGQNVNAYHGEAQDGSTWSLARLLYALADIDGIARLRYMTSHPRDMDTDLIQAHGNIPQLMPFLHLPVQSGSDTILKAMNRQHTAEEYHRIIDALRDARPDITFSSDFIVGYPGETDADFAATMALVERTVYAQAYSFIYSARPGTPASLKSGQIAEDTSRERLAALQALLNKQQLEFNNGCVGKTMEVLFDRAGNRPGQLLGRSPYMQSVHTMANIMPGTIETVTIEKGFSNSLEAHLPGASAAA